MGRFIVYEEQAGESVPDLDEMVFLVPDDSTSDGYRRMYVKIGTNIMGHDKLDVIDIDNTKYKVVSNEYGYARGSYGDLELVQIEITLEEVK